MCNFYSTAATDIMPPESSQADINSESTTASYDRNVLDVNLTPSPRTANLSENELEKESVVSNSNVADFDELNVSDETSGSNGIFIVLLPFTFLTVAQLLVYLM